MALFESVEMSRLSYEIFSILENKFLFDSVSQPQTPVKNSSQNTPKTPNHKHFDYGGGKVRILSIDAAADELSAAAAIVSLESSLRSLSGDSSATIADFFDAVAGSGAGGVLAAMLFSKKPSDGKPLFSAEEAFAFLSSNKIAPKEKTGIMGLFSRKSKNKWFCKIFNGDLTLKDTIKPLLIPCYDLVTGSPFVFSRSDAVESDGYDFSMSDVCGATCAVRTVKKESVDGRTRIAAVGNGAVMGNPTTTVITHVLNNKMEFPFVNGIEDLLVLSLGNGTSDSAVDFDGGVGGFATPSRKQMLRISENHAADTVDQAVAMAFGDNMESSYVRIQASGFVSDKRGSSRSKADEMLFHRNVESVLFRGKKVSKMTNGEKMEKFCVELIKEQERRKTCPVANVIVKQAMSPRSSSATISTTFTSNASSGASTSP